MLVIFYPLRLFVKTLTADDKCSLRNSESLLKPSQMLLSKNLKTSSPDFAQFLKSISNFKHFEKKDEPRSLCISEDTDCEKHG